MWILAYEYGHSWKSVKILRAWPLCRLVKTLLETAVILAANLGSTPPWCPITAFLTCLWLFGKKTGVRILDSPWRMRVDRRYADRLELVSGHDRLPSRIRRRPFNQSIVRSISLFAPGSISTQTQQRKHEATRQNNKKPTRCMQMQRRSEGGAGVRAAPGGTW